MYSRVVVAYDGSARSLSALPVGQASAQLFDCPVQLAHVPVAEDPPKLDRDDVVVLAFDEPAEGLIAHARASEPPGLLCLSTHGRGPVGEAVFGSTAAAVVRGLHAPALVVGPRFVDRSSSWVRMLVCLDGSETSAAILPVVEQWGRTTGMRLHLLHVTYPLGDEVRAGEESEDTRIVAAELRRTATELTDAGIETTWDVVEDTDTVTGITRQAAYRQADVIAMATHGRTGLARLIAGSVAMATVRRSTVPLLLLRPEQLR